MLRNLVLLIALVLSPFAAYAQISGNNPQLRFRELDQALPAGLWRFYLDGNVFKLERNTHASGNFTTVVAAATVGTTGGWTIPALTVSGFTANSFLYSGTSGALTTTAAPTNGQLLIGSTGVAPALATLTAGTNVTITNGAGSITIAATGGGGTGTIDLYPGGFAPDGSGTGNNAATLQLDISTGTQTANTPKAGENVLLFDSTTDEHWEFVKSLPADYSSGGTLRGWVKSSATSGNFVMKGGIGCAVSGTTNSNTILFNAADVSSATAVNGTAGVTVSFTITLTTTNMAASRKCHIFIGRDADNASDTVNSDDIALEALVLEYTKQ
jgi:hypothetical protein